MEILPIEPSREIALLAPEAPLSVAQAKSLLDLPDELILDVLKRLCYAKDVVNFAHVCRRMPPLAYTSLSNRYRIDLADLFKLTLMVPRPQEEPLKDQLPDQLTSCVQNTQAAIQFLGRIQNALTDILKGGAIDPRLINAGSITADLVDDVNTLFVNCKKAAIDSLSGLSKHTLKDLITQIPAHYFFCHEVLFLANIERKIRKGLARRYDVDDYDHTYALLEMVKTLIENNYLDKAYEVVLSIPMDAEWSMSQWNEHIFRAYRDIVKAYISKGYLIDAHVVALSIQGLYKQGEAIIDIVKAYMEKGDLANARTMALSFLGSGYNEPVYADYQRKVVVAILIDIVRAYIAKDDLMNARAVALSIPDSTQQGPAIIDIVKANIVKGDLVNARDVAMSIRYLSWRGTALIEMVKAYIAKDDLVSAHNVAMSILGSASRRFGQREVPIVSSLPVGLLPIQRRRLVDEGEAPNGEALAEIVKANIVKGDLMNARTMAISIKAPTWQGRALIDIIKAYIAKGDLTNAHDEVLSIKDPEQQGEALIEIVKANIKKDDLVNAFNVAMSIKDPKQQGKVLMDIFKAHIAKGDLMNARAVAMSIQYLELQWAALVEVVKAYIVKDDLASAYDVALSIKTSEWSRARRGQKPVLIVKNPKQQGEALIEIVKAYIKKDDLVNAHTVAIFIKDPKQQQEALIGIIEAYIAKDDLTRARDLIRPMRFELSCDKRTIDLTLRQIVAAYIKKDDLATAHDVTMSMKDSWEQGEVLIDIVRVYIKKGDLLNARTMAQFIQDRYGRLMRVCDFGPIEKLPIQAIWQELLLLERSLKFTS